MIKQLMAALLSLFAASVFAAVDVNKATQAELESIKGIGPSISAKMLDERKKAPFKDWNDLVVRVNGVGEGNAAKFSADGLTVNGSGFKGASSTQGKEGKSASKTDSKSGAAEAGTAKAAKTAAKERTADDAARAEEKKAARKAAAAPSAPASAAATKKK